MKGDYRTVLESMPWASAIGKVKFNWREGIETSAQLRFLDDLIRSAEDERSRISNEWFRHRIDELDRQQEKLFEDLSSEISDLKSNQDTENERLHRSHRARFARSHAQMPDLVGSRGNENAA